MEGAIKNVRATPLIPWSFLANLDCPKMTQSSSHSQEGDNPTEAASVLIDVVTEPAQGKARSTAEVATEAGLNANQTGAAAVKGNRTFAQVISTEKFSPSDSMTNIPGPSIKGDYVTVKILEEDYLAGLEECKFSLHGRLILSKGESSPTFTDLKSKLLQLWKITPLNVIPLGRGYFEFTFASMEDMRSIRSTKTWNLKPGLLKLFTWTPDFNPNLQKYWIKIHGLPQEYWKHRTLFTIAGGVGTPIMLDYATKNRALGHFAKVQVEVDLRNKLPSKILVGRKGFSFYVNIEYEGEFT